MSPRTTHVVTPALTTTPESLVNKGTTLVVSPALQHLRVVFRVNLRKSLVVGRLLQVQRFTGRSELVQNSLVKLFKLETARGELETQVVEEGICSLDAWLEWTDEYTRTATIAHSAKVGSLHTESSNLLTPVASCHTGASTPSDYVVGGTSATPNTVLQSGHATTPTKGSVGSAPHPSLLSLQGCKHFSLER